MRSFNANDCTLERHQRERLSAVTRPLVEGPNCDTRINTDSRGGTVGQVRLIHLWTHLSLQKQTVRSIPEEISRKESLSQRTARHSRSVRYTTVVVNQLPKVFM